MKPGRATIKTLTDHVLNFETSRRADKVRDAGISLRVKLWGMAVAVGNTHEVATVLQDFLSARMVAHRELRRAARRLAKLALKQAEELRKEHAESDALITRIIKLEAEIDRTSKLVNWLLHRAQPLPSNADKELARAFLWRILGQTPPTNHVAELARLLTIARAHGTRAA